MSDINDENYDHEAFLREQEKQQEERDRKARLLRFAKKPIHVSELKDTENATLPTQLQQPIKGQRNIRMCPHFFSPAGCQLGSYCQFQHSVVSTATLAAKNRNAAAKLLQQQQQQVANMIENSNDLQREQSVDTNRMSDDDQQQHRSRSPATTVQHQQQQQQRRPSLGGQTTMTTTSLPQLRDNATSRSVSFRHHPPGASRNQKVETPLMTDMQKQHEETQQFFQQQQQQQNQNNAPNNVSTYRWFWRELAKDFSSSETGLSWRPFHPSIENTLETAFVKYREAEEDGKPSLNICMNKFHVDFDKMQLCNADDGGSRRAIQRIRIESGFFWYACELTAGKAAWKFPFDVSCVLEREYVTGNSTSFGIRIGPRAAALISLDSMTMQVLPEVAPLFSSVFDKEVKKQDYHDLIDKIKAEKYEAGLSKEKLRKDGGVREVKLSERTKKKTTTFDGTSSPSANSTTKKKKGLFSNTNDKSPEARNPRRSSDDDDSDTDDSGSELLSNDSDDDNLEEEEIEMIASADDNHQKKKNGGNNDEDDGEGNDDLFDEDDDDDDVLNKKINLADAIVKLARTTNNLNTYLINSDNAEFQNQFSRNNRILTLKLQRQPLAITAACPASDFFGISKLREHACFVADSGETLFSSPELGPDVFGKDELQLSVLPCIRAAVLGATNVLRTNTSSLSNAIKTQNNNNKSGRNTSASQRTTSSSSRTISSSTSSSALPPCSDNCLEDLNLFGTSSMLHQHQRGSTPDDDEMLLNDGEDNNDENNAAMKKKKSFASGVRDVMALTRNKSTVSAADSSTLTRNTSSTSLLQNNKLASLAATAKHLLDRRSFTMAVQHMHAACHRCNLNSSNPTTASTTNQNHRRTFSASSSPYSQNLLPNSSSSQHHHECFLHEIINLSNMYRDRDIQEVATESPEVAKQLRFMSVSAQIRARLHEQFFLHRDHTNNNNDGANNNDKMMSSRSNTRRLSPSSGAAPPPPTTSDRGIAVWYASQNYLKEFKMFIQRQQKEEDKTISQMNNNNNEGGGGAGGILHHTPHPPTSATTTKKKKTARIVDVSDQTLLPIQMLSEGTVEWNRVIEWCAQSNLNPTHHSRSSKSTNNNNSDSTTTPMINVPTSSFEKSSQTLQKERQAEQLQEEIRTVLHLMPRIRRVDRHDFCARYKRCRNEIFQSWVRVQRSEALESAEKLVFIPATPDQVSSLMESTDSTSNALSATKRIVFTSFEAALFASAAANGLLMSAEQYKKNLMKLRKQNQKRFEMTQKMAQQINNNNNNTLNSTSSTNTAIGGDHLLNDDEHNDDMAAETMYLNAMANKLGQTVATKPQGIIVALAYFGPQARAPSCTDRLFNYPSVHSERDPINTEYRCVMNTSAVVEGESNSFVALFLEAQFCPLYFISLSS